MVTNQTYDPATSNKVRRTRRGRQTRAFTLIEVSIAMLMVVVGVLPMIALMMLARHVDNQAKIESAAYNIARQEIDTLKAESWSNRVTGTGTFTIPSSVSSEFPNQSLAGQYNIATVSSTFPALQQITVRVSWTNSSTVSGSPTSSVILDTLAAQGAGE
jgi:type II secretory pathway pseudopilin PulG